MADPTTTRPAPAAAADWVRMETKLLPNEARRLRLFCYEQDRDRASAIRVAIRRMLDDWEASRGTA